VRPWATCAPSPPTERTAQPVAASPPPPLAPSGLLGALLGTAVAYLATIALFRSQLGERMSQVPVMDLTLVVIGLPVVATIGSWLLAGREPPTIAHQPIE